MALSPAFLSRFHPNYFDAFRELIGPRPARSFNEHHLFGDHHCGVGPSDLPPFHQHDTAQFAVHHQRVRHENRTMIPRRMPAPPPPNRVYESDCVDDDVVDNDEEVDDDYDDDGGPPIGETSPSAPIEAARSQSVDDDDNFVVEPSRGTCTCATSTIIATPTHSIIDAPAPVDDEDEPIDDLPEEDEIEILNVVVPPERIESDDCPPPDDNSMALVLFPVAPLPESPPQSLPEVRELLHEEAGAFDSDDIDRHEEQPVGRNRKRPATTRRPAVSRRKRPIDSAESDSIPLDNPQSPPRRSERRRQTPEHYLNAIHSYVAARFGNSPRPSKSAPRPKPRSGKRTPGSRAVRVENYKQ